MENAATTHGRCSFVIPQGFAFDPDASLAIPEEAKKGEEPISICLEQIKPETDEEEDEVGFSDEFDQDAFRIVITLFTLPKKFNKDPMAYLNNANEALKEKLAEFRVDYCKSDSIGGKPAAAGQSFFNESIPLYRLALAWHIEKELAVLSAHVLEKDIEYGWSTLRAFAASIKVIP